MLGIPSPPAHGGSWAVSKSTTVFFWYPFFQMKSFTAFCSVLIRFSSNCGMIWTTWVNFDSASVLTSVTNVTNVTPWDPVGLPLTPWDPEGLPLDPLGPCRPTP